MNEWAMDLVGKGVHGGERAAFSTVCAAARRSRYTKEVIAPGDCLTREQALRAATINGAWLTFDEKRKGSIEPGKLADIAVLDADPLTIKDEGLKTITAEMTFVGGKVVYEREPGEDPAAGLAGL